MPTFPTTPAPAICREENVQRNSIVTQFEDGHESRRNRWHRSKKEFVLVYKTIISGDANVQAIEDHAAIRDFLFARRLQFESFTFAHPYFSNSIYTVRYNMAALPQNRQIRTPADSGTDIWEMEIRLIEVF